MTDRRDLIKKGLLAGGLIWTTPVITTFHIPAAGALTSGCTCAERKALNRKEFFFDLPSGGWGSPPTSIGPCRPVCWAPGDSTNDNRIRLLSLPIINSPMTIARGQACNGAGEGLHAVSAVHVGGECVTDITVSTLTATITAAPGETLSRVFVVGCC